VLCLRKLSHDSGVAERDSNPYNSSFMSIGIFVPYDKRNQLEALKAPMSQSKVG
jgi:hypothetical protein